MSLGYGRKQQNNTSLRFAVGYSSLQSIRQLACQTRQNLQHLPYKLSLSTLVCKSRLQVKSPRHCYNLIINCDRNVIFKFLTWLLSYPQKLWLTVHQEELRPLYQLLHRTPSSLERRHTTSHFHSQSWTVVVVVTDDVTVCQWCHNWRYYLFMPALYDLNILSVC